MTNMIVTVALDLTSDTDRAIPVADALARQLGAVLEMVVVSSPGLDQGIDQIELSERVARVASTPVDTIVIASNDTDEVLTRYAQDPDRVLCVASHGRSAFGEIFMGSLAMNTVRRGGRPVVAVGPRVCPQWHGPLTSIVFAVDEKGTTATVIEAVAALAAALRVDVEVVHVADPAHELSPAEHGGRAALTKIAESLAAHGVRARVVHLFGDVTRSIDEWATRAETRALVVVTTRILGPLDRVLHGSASARLLHHLRAPVLIMPTELASAGPAPVGTVMQAPRSD